MRILLLSFLICFSAAAQFKPFDKEWTTPAKTPTTNKIYCYGQDSYTKLCWIGPFCNFAPERSYTEQGELILEVKPARTMYFENATGSMVSTWKLFDLGSYRAKMLTPQRVTNSLSYGVTSGIYLEYNNLLISLEINSRYQGQIGHKRGLVQFSVGSSTSLTSVFFDPSDEYHIYGLEKKSKEVQFTIDGKIYWSCPCKTEGSARFQIANWAGDVPKSGKPQSSKAYLRVRWASISKGLLTTNVNSLRQQGGPIKLSVNWPTTIAYQMLASFSDTKSGTLYNNALVPLTMDNIGQALVFSPLVTGFSGTSKTGLGIVNIPPGISLKPLELRVIALQLGKTAPIFTNPIMVTFR